MDSSVSIIIVNYNGGELLEECLAALRENTGPGCEVIVVDNASTDGSGSIPAGRYPEVRLIRSPENLGYAAGINLGAHAARGDYLAILNMDVIVQRGWLPPLVTFLNEHPEAGAVTPCILLYERPDRINALGQNVHVTGLGFNRKLNRPIDESDPAPTSVSGLHGSAFVMRSETFHGLGGMNENYFLYHEDVEISMRLALAGLATYSVPESTVRHRYDLHMTPAKLAWLERYRWVTLLETYQPFTLLMLLPLFLITEVMMAGYCLSRGRAFVRAKLAAVRWVLTHLTMVRACRVRVQALRRVPDWRLLSQLRWGYDWDQFVILAKQRGGWILEVMSGVLARRAHDRAT